MPISTIARAETPTGPVQVPETRARILEAAADTIDQLGYRRFRVEDVARAAGMSRQTVVNYFPKKDDLVWAASELRFEFFTTMLDDRVSGFDDRTEGLRVALRESLEVLAATPGTRPPLVDDMLRHLTGKGAPLLYRQFQNTAPVLSALFGADLEPATTAAEAMLRLFLSYLILPPESRDLDLAASVIAETTAAALGYRRPIPNETKRPKRTAKAKAKAR